MYIRPPEDLPGDYFVGLEDFAALALEWLSGKNC
jgi:hypothetical protein